MRSARRWDSTVVVENKPGNGSNLAADLVAKAAPDGYTLLIASPSSISVNPALNPKVSAKPGDLAPVTKITTSPLVLAVNPSTGIQSVQDLVAFALKDPGKLNYASSGNGSAPHLGAALFTKLTGTQMTTYPLQGGFSGFAIPDCRRYASLFWHSALGAATCLGWAHPHPRGQHS